MGNHQLELFFPFPKTRRGSFRCFFGWEPQGGRNALVTRGRVLRRTYSFGASSKIPCQADMAGSASNEMFLIQRLAAISWGPPRIVDLHIHMIYKCTLGTN